MMDHARVRGDLRSSSLRLPWCTLNTARRTACVPHAMSNPTDGVRVAPRHRVVAIDLGTHGSGFAHCREHNQKPKGGISQHESWPDQPCPYPKTRSALLYRNRTPVAWGWGAHKQVLQLSPEEQASHWYIEDFKLALQDEDKAAEIRAKGLTPEQVMADYLQQFGKYIKQDLRKTLPKTEDLNNIQWCLTVPAMWSESSKALMRRAAVRAGLIKTHDDAALKIILEPEAAALHARETNAPPLKPGMTVCILDVGGGTADITVHDVKLVSGQAVLAEAVCADGAMCGSAYVDMAFRSYYSSIVGSSTFDKWAAAYPTELQQVIDKWITIKHNFIGVPGKLQSDSHQYRVPIPPHLLHDLEVDTLASLSKQQGNTSHPDIILTSQTVAQLFDGPVTQVVEAATKQLNKLSKQCSVVILVGGFAASPYLQARVRQALVHDSKLTSQVVVPPTPYASVLQGAVIYGCNPAIIHARRSRMAYGIRTCTKYVDGAPPDSKFWHAEEGDYYTNAKFLRYVAKDELVEQDQVVTQRVNPLYKSQTSTTARVFATDDNSVRWIHPSLSNECRELAAVQVELSEPGRDRDVEVQFQFGQTELHVTAWDHARKEPVKTNVKFAHD